MLRHWTKIHWHFTCNATHTHLYTHTHTHIAFLTSMTPWWMEVYCFFLSITRVMTITVAMTTPPTMSPIMAPLLELTSSAKKTCGRSRTNGGQVANARLELNDPSGLFAARLMFVITSLDIRVKLCCRVEQLGMENSFPSCGGQMTPTLCTTCIRQQQNRITALCYFQYVSRKKENCSCFL